jgi:hypothetical protein
MAAAKSYRKHVFINCPFDRAYRPLFEALVFAVHDAGYIARSAQEVRDTGEVRIGKILRLVRDSKFGIHDISRTTLDRSTRLPRFNMPLELGIFLGAKEFGDRRQRQKVTLVLEGEKYSYLKFCSDISGQDPEAHDEQPAAAVKIVRNWLRTHSSFGMPSAEAMLRRFRRFRRQLPAMCHRLNLNPASLIFVDYAALVAEWLAENPLNEPAPSRPRAREHRTRRTEGVRSMKRHSGTS